jgi:hypothetical protein
MIFGPIQSMDEDRPLLWRLFHTGWLGRLFRLEAQPQFTPPVCATVQFLPSASRAARQMPVATDGDEADFEIEGSVPRPRR